MKLLPSLKCLGSLCVGALAGFAMGFLVLAGQITYDQSQEEVIKTIRGTFKGVTAGIVIAYLLWVFVASKWE